MSDQLPPPMPRVGKMVRAPATTAEPTGWAEPPAMLAPPVLDPTIDTAPTSPTQRLARERHSRRERFIAMRAISIPTSVVRRFFGIDGIRKAMLMAFNLFISVIPLVIVAFALVSRVRNRISLSQVFIEQ